MPQGDKKLHVYSEIASVLLAVPLLILVAGTVKSKDTKIVLLGAAAAMLLVDGYLLSKAREW